MKKSTFEEQINIHGRLVYSNVGDSMMPFIRQGRDLVIISQKPEGRLKKYDVPLYKRDTGQYVLHRILKVRQDDYVICGDNRYSREYGIGDRNIIGVLTAIDHNGTVVPVTDRKYMFKVHLWCDFFYVRAFILRLRTYIRRIRKKRK